MSECFSFFCPTWGSVVGVWWHVEQDWTIFNLLIYGVREKKRKYIKFGYKTTESKVHFESVDLWLSFPSNLAGHVTWLGAHHPSQPPQCLLLCRQAGFSKKSDRTDLTGGWSISAPKEWEMSHVVVQKEIYQQWNLPQQLELNTLQYTHYKRKNIQQ